MTWEVAAREIAQLGSFHLEKYPWEVAAGGKAIGKLLKIKMTIYTIYSKLSDFKTN